MIMGIYDCGSGLGVWILWYAERFKHQGEKLWVWKPYRGKAASGTSYKGSKS